MFNLGWYKNKKVLVSGHTGFKGSWLCKLLIQAGANVTGYALEPTTTSLFEIADIKSQMDSIIGDIRDYAMIKKTFDEVQPEIVIHLAAQPIVRASYERPRYTYEANVMGTVNLLECVRQCDSVRSVLNVTTDKVYLNRECDYAYKENDVLDGYDPYSNSKSCSELVTHSYKNSFFQNGRVAVSTARAGNVIGGGDFASDRIIPDCISAAMKNEKIIVRNPFSVRPYQHVLDPLYAYMMIASYQYGDLMYQGYYNIGPDDGNCIQTGKLVDLFCRKWGDNCTWQDCHSGGPHEAKLLRLDCTKMKETFNWSSSWNIEKAIDKVVEWTRCWIDDANIDKCMMEEISQFLSDKEGSK